jgi:hypothetical protein
MHHHDTDCTISPADDCCAGCGVYHGDPCEDCGGRGFHESACPQLLPEFAAADRVQRMTVAEAAALPGLLGRVATFALRRHGHYTYTEAASGERVLLVLAAEPAG